VDASFTTLVAQSCETLASSVFHEVVLSYLVSAGLAEHISEILSINLLFSHLHVWKSVPDLGDFLFALGTGVLAVSDPLLDALVAIDVTAWIQGRYFLLVNYFETDCAGIFYFLWVRQSKWLSIRLDSPPHPSSSDLWWLWWFLGFFLRNDLPHPVVRHNLPLAWLSCVVFLLKLWSTSFMLVLHQLVSFFQQHQQIIHRDLTFFFFHWWPGILLSHVYILIDRTLSWVCCGPVSSINTRHPLI